jgi:hypothetical protein
VRRGDGEGHNLNRSWENSIQGVRETAFLQSNSETAQQMTCIFNNLLTKLAKYGERIKGANCQFRRRRKFTKIAYFRNPAGKEYDG